MSWLANAGKPPASSPAGGVRLLAIVLRLLLDAFNSNPRLARPSIPKGLDHSARGWHDSESAYPGWRQLRYKTLKGLNINVLQHIFRFFAVFSGMPSGVEGELCLDCQERSIWRLRHNDSLPRPAARRLCEGGEAKILIKTDQGQNVAPLLHKCCAKCCTLNA
jgi:hypothetical protein